MEVWGGNQAVDTGVAMSGLDAWVYSKPFGQSEAGGDVYYVSSCATGRITRLLVADVAGHGGAVDKTAVELRGLMRQFVNYLDQTRFVTEMNARFSALSQNGCCATADVVANLPLGIMDLSDYQQFDLTLDPSDLVLCYTDSLIESRDPTGELLGTAGLLRILNKLMPSDPKAFIPELLAAISAEAPGNLADDDVTVLAYRPNGKPARMSLGRRLMAPARVLRGVAGAVRAGIAAPWPEFSVANLGGACFNRLNHAWKGRNRGKLPDR
jgi:sigma-B regulation protein RsbU (phosphoserine phosphatase)